MQGYTVTVAETGETFTCNQNEILLAAMRRTGKGPIQYGCFGGGCGVCKVKIISGDYQVVKKMSHAHVLAQNPTDGTVLACCVTPRGNITVSRV
ncbi:2Fe-2S iron-sulfur cluster binding domain-containing protein [Ruminococcaceae bacterium OttesenSCG-928-A16]|nr:2Fe-2S iron-sulfur cluster binding domain-containing protein [Ruminococcaceae bacterium OttesenSCG-928-A16]